MFYRRYTPRGLLSAFVVCIWYSEGFEGTHEQERLLPNGESAIIFDLRENVRQRPLRIYDAQKTDSFESYAPAIFCGARTDCFVIDTSEQERVIGIQFRPGGAFPFLGMPACEVANATYSLDDIWPGQTEVIREELLFAGEVGLMFSVLERALTARLRHARMPHPAMAFAIGKLARPALNVRVGDVADLVGLSSRRMMELFREQTGLTPKAFQRVRRFQHVLRNLRVQCDGNWAALAADCGYYDQPHFIHDFRMFAGMTPSEYVSVATPHLNHVPLK
jgi:AraC-like DNA-binding protein